jgi:hypothetical protein
LCSGSGCRSRPLRRVAQALRGGGVGGLVDQPKPGRPAQIDEVAVVPATLEPPPQRLGVTHWSSRLLAAELGISHVWVGKIWRRWGLQPWRSETFRFPLTGLGGVLRFLKQVAKAYPAKLHVVLDNYGSHKHPTVRARLEHHRWDHSALHPPRDPGSTWSRSSSASSPAKPSAAAASPVSKTSSPRSVASSTAGTTAATLHLDQNRRRHPRPRHTTSKGHYIRDSRHDELARGWCERTRYCV